MEALLRTDDIPHRVFGFQKVKRNQAAKIPAGHRPIWQQEGMDLSGLPQDAIDLLEEVRMVTMPGHLKDEFQWMGLHMIRSMAGPVCPFQRC